MKLMTEMHCQGQTCTTILGEGETLYIVSCSTSSITNNKKYTYIVDN